MYFPETSIQLHGWHGSLRYTYTPCSWDRIAVLNANFTNTNCEGEKSKFTLTALLDRQLEEIGASAQGQQCKI